MEHGTFLRLLWLGDKVNGGVFAMRKMIKVRDARGKLVAGSFDVREGMITVTASDGRTKTAAVAESLLSTETLSRSLLLLLENEKHADRVSSVGDLAEHANRSLREASSLQQMRQSKRQEPGKAS
jgi:hypothetical protein